MKTYLHFTPGDTLLFASVVPTSPGAIFGACLVFFLVSVADRWLRAYARQMQGRFVRRSVGRTLPLLPLHPQTRISRRPATTAPPTPAAPRFILSHELARGGVEGLQTTLHYLLMLVVMTFNAAYIISVILGVVVGEVAFGRLGRAQ
ncbi:Ctr copper transporter [Mycena rebaudengoi]|nr:Ctr copper transporter [Mycena rebaudengoi]